MAIHCPNCLQRFRARDDLLGKRVKCPKCEERFTVSDKAQVNPPDRRPPHDPVREEIEQPIPLDTSPLSIIGANRLRSISALLPLFFLLQGGFSRVTARSILQHSMSKASENDVNAFMECDHTGVRATQRRRSRVGKARPAQPHCLSRAIRSVRRLLWSVPTNLTKPNTGR